MNFLNIGNSANFMFKFTSSIKGRPMKKIKHDNGRDEDLLIFQGNEPIRGEVTVFPRGKKLEHIGIKIELIGQITIENGTPTEFTSLVRELDSGPCTMYQEETYPFAFENAKKEYDSYNGINVNLRYFLRVTVSKPYGMKSTKEQDFWVRNIKPEPMVNNNIKMEVGIEECLHLEFEYDQSKYCPGDPVVGKIFFVLVRIKIKHMELAIIRRETTGNGQNQKTSTQTLTKYEIMDGCPIRGECIPVRLFLNNIGLTPTYVNNEEKLVNNMFSVRYFLNLVLVDQQDRRYFKQQEIGIYARDIEDE